MNDVAIRNGGTRRRVHVRRDAPLWPGPFQPLTVYWAAFVGSAACFIFLNLLDGLPAFVVMALSIASSVTCGLAWLLARSLFRGSDKGASWPLVLVGLLFACTLISRFSDTDPSNAVLTYVATLQTLIGSAMLVLIVLEPMNASAVSPQEQRFRLTFIGGYLAILATALAARLPELLGWQSVMQVSLCLISVLGATLAVRYRQKGCEKTPGAASAALSHPEIAARLTRVIEETALYRQPGLKVSDLARHLKEPEYRISQAIVQDLGQANFNRWINTYRIAEAKTCLSAPGAEELSILNLSFDCGFNSLGPFNRAFKAETGMTPSQFRRQAVLVETD